jgi:hypothetical protein
LAARGNFLADGHVSFTYRDREHGGVIRALTLPAASFIDRFLMWRGLRRPLLFRNVETSVTT